MFIMSKINWIFIVLGNTIINKFPSRYVRNLYYRLLGAKLSKNSVIFRRVEILRPKKLEIDKQSSVGWFTLLDCRGGIKIGKNVTVASYCKLITAKHDIEDSNFAAVYAPIEIEDYSWIATGATILSGVKIGRGAIVCSGAVVTKSVPNMAVVAGVPARIIKYRKVEPNFQDDMKWSWLH